MGLYKCQDCGREISEEEFKKVLTKNKGREPPCKECGGTFEKVSPAKEEVEEDEEETSEEIEGCLICGKELKDGEDVSWSEDEGYEGPIFKDYEIIAVCKKCIDKKYPRKVEVKEVIKPVRIDRPSADTKAVDSVSAKTKFD